ncbi:MAG: hypothetical protein RLZZ455_1194 [Candidatus Parcubacteria bacterium]|jgi:hypothetical protein
MTISQYFPIMITISKSTDTTRFPTLTHIKHSALLQNIIKQFPHSFASRFLKK